MTNLWVTVFRDPIREEYEVYGPFASEIEAIEDAEEGHLPHRGTVVPLSAPQPQETP